MRAISTTTDPRAKLVLRMSLYGMALSTFGGLMFVLVILAEIPPSDITLEDYRAALLHVAITGGGIGFVYGSIASTVLGIVIASLTLVFFREAHHPRLFRAAAGVITAVGIYFVSPLEVVPWSLSTIMNRNGSRYPGTIAVLVLYVLAIYLSQIVSRKYIREVSPSGRKANPR